MKLNCKGFMLAEVVVVSVVIATVLVTLFTGLRNVSSAYQTRNRYYDIDSLYAAIEYSEILERSNVSLNGIINDAELLYSWAREWTDIDIGQIQRYEEFYYYEIGDYIIGYITPYNKEKMLSLESYDGKTNTTFGDYLDYLSGNLDFTADYDYMIIVERRKNRNIDDCYYYALKLKY